jgi:hypothetical protein
MVKLGTTPLSGEIAWKKYLKNGLIDFIVPK